jgi:hypothetical protein
MVIFGPDNFRTTCTQPLSFRSYLQYFLVPHIACGLISQDKGTDLEGAWEIMVESAEIGTSLQSLTIQENILEEIFTANAKLSKSCNIFKEDNGTKAATTVNKANAVSFVS